MLPLIKTHRVKVTNLQPTVCKRCWARPAVNSVEVGATDVGFPACQPCTNVIITSFSESLNDTELRKP